MLPVPLLLLVFQALESTAWGRPQLGSIVSKSRDGTRKQRGKTSEEVKALLASMEQQAALHSAETLTSVSTNPSCFFFALSSVPSDSPCEDLSRNDMRRTEVAAGMALCELKTAGDGGGVGKVPRECSDWQEGRGRSRVGGCVEALSRSPQQWSSYSGYLREVVTLCSSYRRWADLESARSLYSSTATTFVAFIIQLQAFERARTEREADDTEARKLFNADLTQMTAQIDQLTSQLAKAHSTQITSLSSLQDALNSSVDKFQSILNEGFLAHLSSVLHEVDLRGKSLVSEMGRGLEGVRQLHTSDLAQVVDVLDQRVGNSLVGLQASVGDVVLQMGTLEQAIQSSSWVFDESSKVMEGLVSRAESVSTVLSGVLSDSREIKATHLANFELQNSHSQRLEEILKALSAKIIERRSFFSSFSLSTSLWWLSFVGGILRGGISFKSVASGLVPLLVGDSTPFLSHIGTMISLMPALISAFMLLFAFVRKLWCWRRSTHARHESEQTLQLEIYHPPAYLNARPHALRRLPAPRNSRVPSRLYSAAL